MAKHETKCHQMDNCMADWRYQESTDSKAREYVEIVALIRPEEPEEIPKNTTITSCGRESIALGEKEHNVRGGSTFRLRGPHHQMVSQRQKWLFRWWLCRHLLPLRMQNRSVRCVEYAQCCMKINDERNEE